jgi:hypothetical protein
MRTMNQAVSVQNLEILTDCDLRGLEFAGHIHDQNAAVAVKDFDNRPSPFFVEHVSSEGNTKTKNLPLLIALSFYIVSFRLSSAMCTGFRRGVRLQGAIHIQ